jgi:hypothetical protein
MLGSEGSHFILFEELIEETKPECLIADIILLTFEA